MWFWFFILGFVFGDGYYFDFGDGYYFQISLCDWKVFGEKILRYNFGAGYDSKILILGKKWDFDFGGISGRDMTKMPSYIDQLIFKHWSN